MLKRPPTDRLEETSILGVQNFFNENGWEYTPQPRDKTGIDGQLEIIEGIRRTGLLSRCQVKSGQSYVTSETEDLLRIRVEHKYLEHWSGMTGPVLLFFYHQDKRIYWKAVKEYLRAHPNLLGKPTEHLQVIFDKDKDLLTSDSLPALRDCAEGKLNYEYIAIEKNRTELSWSNWFPVTGMPGVWGASTVVSAKSQIDPFLEHGYAYTVHGGQLISFSDLRLPQSELRKYVNPSTIRPALFDAFPQTVVAEMLGYTVDLLRRQKGLFVKNERFYFPASLLRDPETNKYGFEQLKGGIGERTLVYVETAPRVHYRHHAVRLAYTNWQSKWFLQIDPAWHISFPAGAHYEVGEAKSILISTTADTQNKDYLYLVHFWRRFLSSGKNTIEIPFRFFNDYTGPKN
jgi:hypothetical protein